tara:strand:- start:96 stop:818 length:723 start_codon:yes stop_codon:yes gene_type:complete
LGLIGLYFPEYAINIIVLVKIFSVAINRFLQRISQDGGLASSNNFVVKFMNPPFGMPNGLDEAMEFYCNEAQLPNLNTAEGTINGLYLGSGSIKYAHTRVFTEVQLGFLCDANMTIMKFLNAWQEYMFNEDLNPSKEVNRNVTVKYQDDYVCDIAIAKTELSPYEGELRNPLTYILERAYPYAIDAVPLQFGTNQVTQVTAQFSYMRHYPVHHDIRGVTGDTIGLENRLGSFAGPTSTLI